MNFPKNTTSSSSEAISSDDSCFTSASVYSAKKMINSKLLSHTETNRKQMIGRFHILKTNKHTAQFIK